MTIDDCRIIDLSRINRPEGSLTVVEANRDVPFRIARVYYLYDVPSGASRGGHAHKHVEQLIVSATGSFAVVVDDGSARQTIRLDRAYRGLYVPRLIWRELQDFSTGAVCLVLASDPFSEVDYLRNYDEYAAARRGAR
jgi:hypothetical protein